MLDFTCVSKAKPDATLLSRSIINGNMTFNGSCKRKRYVLCGVYHHYKAWSGL